MPSFHQSGGVLSNPNSVLLHRITNGYKGPHASIKMPPKGGNPSLTEQDLSDALAYIRHTFGPSH